MSDRQGVLRKIQGAVKAREKADADKRKATEDLQRAVQTARIHGIPMKQIVNETGLSRQAVYDLLAARPSS